MEKGGKTRIVRELKTQNIMTRNITIVDTRNARATMK